MADENDSTKLAQSRTDWAESRTDWAEDRTVLANERTFAAWIRTGLTCVVIAIALQAVFGEFEPTWIAKAAATVFLIAAVAIFWSARARAGETLQKLNSRDCDAQPTRNFTWLAIILSAGAAGSGFILWWL